MQFLLYVRLVAIDSGYRDPRKRKRSLGNDEIPNNFGNHYPAVYLLIDRQNTALSAGVQNNVNSIHGILRADKLRFFQSVFSCSGLFFHHVNDNDHFAVVQFRIFGGVADDLPRVYLSDDDILESQFLIHNFRSD